jgi:exopolyphosphatase/guanosine-5'-triphosphate,3'-diphosphate pyrophosphatase
MSTVAVVDIGSNSTRLLIAELSTEGQVTSELARRSNVTRLGAGVDSDGRLREDAMERVYATLRDYRSEIDAAGADRAVAVLTSAVRDAANGREFAESVRDGYGLEPHILVGEDEARLTFLGATSDRDPDDRAPTVVIDIGGGSTELVIGAGGEILHRVSTQAGVVRQTERHLHSDPPEPEELARLTEDVDAILDAAVPVEQRELVERGIAVAGTATQLAAIAQELDPYDPNKVHGYELMEAECERIFAELAAVPLELRRRTVGLDPSRAPTIVAGAQILKEVMQLFGLGQVEVSEHDILRGAAMELGRQPK